MPSVITTSKSSPCQRSNASSPSSVEIARCPRLSNCMVRVRRSNGMLFRKQDRERPCLFPFLDLGNSGASFGGLAGRRPGQRKIELDREAGAFARFAAQADPAAHQVYQAPADTLLMSPGSVLRQAASLARRRASRSVRLRSPGKRKGEPPLGADVPRTGTGLLWRRNEKRALRPFLNALQTSLELYRSIFGAGNETRTRDPDLGKVVLYQLSYSRIVLVTGAIL